MKAAVLGSWLFGVSHGMASLASLHAQDATTLSSSDSSAILHAAWRLLSAGHPPQRVLWLWVPPTPDSTGVVVLSPPLRSVLVQRHLPVAERRPAGDDTVVFRLTRWETASADILVEFRSEWTTVLGRGARRCRTKSANVQRIRVQRRNGAWDAAWTGPVLHGDSLCRPIDGTSPASPGRR